MTQQHTITLTLTWDELWHLVATMHTRGTDRKLNAQEKAKAGNLDEFATYDNNQQLELAQLELTVKRKLLNAYEATGGDVTDFGRL